MYSIPKARNFAPSPPSDGGEGWGEEASCKACDFSRFLPSSPGYNHAVRSSLTIALVFVVAALRPIGAFAANVPPSDKYSELTGKLSAFIHHEMQEKSIPAISIALVEDQRIVWSAGFGNARTNAPATADTIYRVGSVSKLFTDIAIMRLVERGVLDLDAPVTKYVPSFHPTNKFGKAITLRELMAHRSGLCREPPVGNYFDPTEPSLTATIESLNQTELVYEPGTHEKYSNAGVGVLGYVLELTQQKPYAEYIEEEVLRPLGLNQSSFRPTAAVRENLADGLMWTIHGRTFAAPKFELGIAPAGCMYSSVNELGHFMTVLFARGRSGGTQIVKPETLEEMWRVQFGEKNAKEGFGLGFHLQQVKGERAAGHNGAIYGFATRLTALVDAKLGVAVVASKDFANTVTDVIGMKALVAMLALKNGTPLPELPITEPVPLEIAKSVEGRYANESQSRGFELSRSGTNLTFLWDGGGFPQMIRQYKGEMFSDGLTGFGMQLARDPAKDLIRIGGTEYHPVSEQATKVPDGCEGLIGAYGWDHDTLYILERDGKLWALIEWFEFDPLEQVSENVFRFPNRGLYDGEKLIFTRNDKGRATEVIGANVRFKRRSVGPEHGNQLQLKPTRPIAEIRAEALKANPPEEKGEFRKTDLVELIKMDPSLHLDIRYAGTNNFLGTQFYTEARAFLQRPAAEALVRVNNKLHKNGGALMIFDGYRPWYVTKIFWDATPDEHKFLVADPGQGSRHNRGCAVDLTICDQLTGEPIEMVGTYDEASDRSYPDYPGGTSSQRHNRKLLRDAMESEGFTVYPEEWWHFDYNQWRNYPIQNVPFEKIVRP
jgi:CubicO group peptidase (beta-lactamase class C family)/D-alanyl-D-alanine dipeptidase